MRTRWCTLQPAAFDISTLQKAEAVVHDQVCRPLARS